MGKSMSFTKRLKNGLTRVARRRRRRKLANKAIAYLQGQHRRNTWSCRHGYKWLRHCAHTVACSYPDLAPNRGAASGWNAYDGWLRTVEKHQRDGRNKWNPPRGAVCFWRGGQFGHVAISNGRRKIWGNDAPWTGKIGLVPITWFGRNWGYQYVGWVWADELPLWKSL